MVSLRAGDAQVGLAGKIRAWTPGRQALVSCPLGGPSLGEALGRPRSHAIRISPPDRRERWTLTDEPPGAGASTKLERWTQWQPAVRWRSASA